MEVLDETVPLYMAFDTEKTLIHYFVDQVTLSQISEALQRSPHSKL